MDEEYDVIVLGTGLTVSKVSLNEHVQNRRHHPGLLKEIKTVQTDARVRIVSSQIRLYE